MAASTSSDVPPLGKYLASTDKKIRDKAIKNLTILLSDPSHDDMPKAEMTKLWKGIFYCFWMSDKPLVQQALATEIAEIVLSIPKTESALAFLRGFWEAMVREWGGIDRLRIDKYYMLARRFVNVSFRLLIRADWDNAVCAEYNSILADKGGPLCPEDNRVPVSLAYHLADIYAEELDKALARSEDAPPAPLNILIQPFLLLAARTVNKTTRERVQSALLEPLLSAFSQAPAPEDDDADEDGARRNKRPRLSEPEYSHLVSRACAVAQPQAQPAAAIKKAMLTQIFDAAGDETTRDANRRKLYALWKRHADEDEDSG